MNGASSCDGVALSGDHEAPGNDHGALTGTTRQPGAAGAVLEAAAVHLWAAAAEAGAA